MLYMPCEGMHDSAYRATHMYCCCTAAVQVMSDMAMEAVESLRQKYVSLIYMDKLVSEGV